jgi:hypothetical protein
LFRHCFHILHQTSSILHQTSYILHQTSYILHLSSPNTPVDFTIRAQE